MSLISDDEVPDWIYSRQGIALFLNNSPEAAVEHFKARADEMPIAAGFTFLSFTVSA
jgi:hypothetical protein